MAWRLFWSNVLVATEATRLRTTCHMPLDPKNWVLGLLSKNNNPLSMMSKLEGKWLEMITLFCRSLSMMTKKWAKGSKTHVQNQKWYDLCFGTTWIYSRLLNSVQMKKDSGCWSVRLQVSPDHYARLTGSLHPLSDLPTVGAGSRWCATMPAFFMNAGIRTQLFLLNSKHFTC